LRPAFEAHGAPLVIKHDNGAIFQAEEVKVLLLQYGVVELARITSAELTRII